MKARCRALMSLIVIVLVGYIIWVDVISQAQVVNSPEKASLHETKLYWKNDTLFWRNSTVGDESREKNTTKKLVSESSLRRITTTSESPATISHSEISLWRNTTTLNQSKPSLKDNASRKDSKYNWGLFLGNESKSDDENVAFRIKTHGKVSIHFDEAFHSGLLLSIPLKCFPGVEGLIPPKYREFVSMLISYTHSYNEMKKSASGVLVWQCRSSYICGGLSDQFQGILTSLVLAMFSGRRLVLQWERPQINYYLTPNFIDWDDQDVIQTIKNEKIFTNNRTTFHRSIRIGASSFIDVKIDSWQECLTMIRSKIPYVVLNTNILLHSLVLKDTTSGQKWIEDGLKHTSLAYLSWSEIDNLLGIVIRYLFVLDPLIIKEVKSAMRVLQIDSAPYIGLHLRTGFVGSKSVHDDQNRKLVKNPAKWMQALRCAVNTANIYLGTASAIFLATDSNEVKQMAVSEFGLRFRSLNANLIHVDKIRHRSTILKEVEKEGFVTTLVDLFILAQSFVILRGESGYSLLSATVCSIPEEHILNSFD